VIIPENGITIKMVGARGFEPHAIVSWLLSGVTSVLQMEEKCQQVFWTRSTRYLRCSTPAEKAEGVIFVRMEKGAAVFEVMSGQYNFKVQSP
jgi:hypothetical protein